MEINIIDDGGANYYKEANNIHILAFGKVKVNSPIKAKIKINGVESSNLIATCGCSVVLSDEKNIFTMQYNDANVATPFAKTFILDYREDDKNRQAQIRITGNIIQ